MSAALRKLQIMPAEVVTSGGSIRLKCFGFLIHNAGTVTAYLNGNFTLPPGFVLNVGYDNPVFEFDDKISISFAAGAGTKQVEILPFRLGLESHNG